MGPIYNEQFRSSTMEKNGHFVAFLVVVDNAFLFIPLLLVPQQGKTMTEAELSYVQQFKRCTMQ